MRKDLPQDEHLPTPYEQALAVKNAHEHILMQKANVVGVGVGVRQKNGKLTDEIAIVVMVDKKRPVSHLDPHDLIPSEIKGVPVDVQEIGRPEAQ